ncbi:MAG: hypothetical protein ACLR6B_07075 [Blautia sp.]
MFLDLTPGTPPTFRKPVLTDVYGNGFDVEQTTFGVATMWRKAITGNMRNESERETRRFSRNLDYQKNKREYFL